MLQFSKYQGTGNDFVLIDNRQGQIKLSTKEIRFLCDRHFGIGADGLMLLQNHPDFDFEMVYFNSDGNESTMCGNGGRCIVAFARQLEIIENTARFLAIDGAHEAEVLNDNRVSLGMIDVAEITQNESDFVLSTGSPHYVHFIERSPNEVVDFVAKAQSIRNNETFKADGINVNFAHMQAASVLQMRTYERGVENETLSCGTGTVAVAIAAHAKKGGAKGTFTTQIHTPGGQLAVKFTYDTRYQQVALIGPATHVFNGNIVL
ncbi:diaminopimelate epimerase [bacterium]|nr:diaminopimelate epimerase [bacterium]